MSIKTIADKGALKNLIPYTLRFDDKQHRKLKVIAAHYGDSLSTYLQKVFNKEINEWERTHGAIELPKE